MKNLVAGESGVVTAKHARKNVLQLAAYTPIVDEKMPSAIKWGVLLRAPEAQILASVNQSLYVFYISLFAGIAVLGVAAYLALRYFGNQFTKIATSIQSTVQATRKVSDDMNEASSDQSACASEQSSAIQESASALSEMSSMIQQTATNTKASLAKAQDVAERSSSGREIMSKLLKSMQAIESANASLQDIGRIISDINVKTGVINSIVFKTQLLSFNASIEAARAGQYGRGFAVVAEEVGNLAQMSGSAAREIEALLTDSQKQVATTLDSIRQRVKESNVVSEEAGRTFNEIATAIDAIAAQVKNIAEASEQQSLGVEQTQKAMGQLDIVARKNYQTSQTTMRVAADARR